MPRGYIFCHGLALCFIGSVHPVFGLSYTAATKLEAPVPCTSTNTSVLVPSHRLHVRHCAWLLSTVAGHCLPLNATEFFATTAKVFNHGQMLQCNPVARHSLPETHLCSTERMILAIGECSLYAICKGR